MKESSKKERNISFLHDIEDDFPVERLVYKGVNWWPYIRVSLGFSLWFDIQVKDNLITKKQHYFSSVLMGLIEVLRSSKNVLSHWKKLTKTINCSSRISLYTSTQATEYHDNKKLCQYTDPILIALNNSTPVSSIQVISKNSDIEDSPLPTSHLFNTPHIELLKYNITSFFKTLFFSKKDELPEIFYQFASYVNDKNGTPIFSLELFHKRITEVLIWKEKFIGIFRKNKVNICFATGYYSTTSLYGAILATKKLQIPYVDCQHGTLSNTHWAYTKWKKIPKTGYLLLPSWYFVYNKEDENFLNKTFENIKGHRVKVIGNTWAKMSLKNNISDKYISCFSNTKLNILYTPNSSFSSKYMYEFMKSTQHKYNWLIRFHPRMKQQQESNKNIYTSLGFIIYKSDKPTNMNLFHLLSKVDAHISDMSGVVLDSLVVGLKSIIVGENGLAIYKEHIEKNNVVYCSNYSELKRQIENNQFKFEVNESKTSTTEIVDLVLRENKKFWC